MFKTVTCLAILFLSCNCHSVKTDKMQNYCHPSKLSYIWHTYPSVLKGRLELLLILTWPWLNPLRSHWFKEFLLRFTYMYKLYFIEMYFKIRNILNKYKFNSRQIKTGYLDSFFCQWPQKWLSWTRPHRLIKMILTGLCCNNYSLHLFNQLQDFKCANSLKELKYVVLTWSKTTLVSRSK